MRRGGFWGGTNGDGGAGESGSLASGRGVGATRDGTGKGLSSGSLWGEYRVVGGFGAFEAPSSLLCSGFVWGRARRKASLLAKIEAVLMGRSRRLPKKQLNVRRCHTRGSIFCAWGVAQTHWPCVYA